MIKPEAAEPWRRSWRKGGLWGAEDMHRPGYRENALTKGGYFPDGCSLIIELLRMPLSQYEQKLTYGFTFCADNQAVILIRNRGIRCGERTWTQQPRNRKNATAPSTAETISFSFLQHLSTWWCGICSRLNTHSWGSGMSQKCICRDHEIKTDV